MNSSRFLTPWLILAALPLTAASLKEGQATTANGVVVGLYDPATKDRVFRGIPFAQPPVGDLRWKAPQPVKNWSGTRQAYKFGPRAMQRNLFGDMKFRSNGMSEDCLYLNVWTPAESDAARLPVLVYFYGGGFQAGDGSESRYDGESMARKGIVALTVNYRLSVFGFMAHPELSAESPYHASGNYGLLDQAAALLWVQRNIAAFGGDPKRVTIAGESAGSISVSAQMASPLSKSLIAGAIGESGSVIGALPPVPLAEAEKAGTAFAEQVGAKSLAELRAVPANELLEDTAKSGTPRFPLVLDGYFFPEGVADIFKAGEQARVPLLVGWNSEEMTGRVVLGGEATGTNYVKALRRLYPKDYERALHVYPAGSTPEEVEQTATELASDRFIAYSTWKWADLHGQTSGQPVYRYYYAHPRPSKQAQKGAVHSAEIEYALGNLRGNTVFTWTDDDFRLSNTMENYFANFVKTGNPNGRALPEWPAANKGDDVKFMCLDVNSRVETDHHRDRYLFLDELAARPK